MDEPIFFQGKPLYAGDLIALNENIESVHESRRLMGLSKITDEEAQAILDKGVPKQWMEILESMAKALASQ